MGNAVQAGNPVCIHLRTPPVMMLMKLQLIPTTGKVSLIALAGSRFAELGCHQQPPGQTTVRIGIGHPLCAALPSQHQAFPWTEEETTCQIVYTPAFMEVDDKKPMNSLFH
jgi:hypothetical protein